MNRPDRTDSGPGTDDVPEQCPACRSREVTTASKVVNAASYWRCRACGEVWNVKRTAAAFGRPTFAPYRRW